MTGVLSEADGKRRCISAAGHADSVETCNYITGVLYALAGFVVNEAERGRAEVIRLRMEEGNVVIEAQGGERVEAAFEMATVGLLQLEKTCPEAIAVECIDRG